MRGPRAAIISGTESENMTQEKDTQGKDAKVKAKRIRMGGRLIAAGAGLALLIALFVLLRPGYDSNNGAARTAESKEAAGREAATTSAPAAFDGPQFESSGVIQVPGADGVLFVDDGRSGECFWVRLDGSGRQAGPIKTVFIDASVEDPESITFDGYHFYIAGSQSDPKAGKRNALVRFNFDPTSAAVSNLEKIEDLRGFLLKSMPELKAESEKAGAEGGLNVEGITWDPDNQRLLLGLRSPMAEDQALVLPIRFKDLNGPFVIENLEPAAPEAIKLRLGDLGIRDIHYDSRLKSFLIIAGAPKEREKGGYTLWSWDGRPGEQGLRRIMALDPRLKPEGITRVEAGGEDFVFVVFDSSSYIKLDYSSLIDK
jgi:hypothetical protein